jgi:ATP-dependent Lon protease
MTPPESDLVNILGAPAGSFDSTGARASGKSLPERLPVLGLSDIVVFPGMVTPLLVESAQSIRLIDDVVAGDRFLALVLQRRAEDTHPGPDDLYDCGCAARVVKMLKFPDHTVRVLVEGLRRCRVVKYTAREPYLIAQMEWIDEAQDDSIELKALARTVHVQFQEVINLSPALSEQVKVAAMNSDEPGATADLAASHLNFSLPERQSLLEAGDVKVRLTRLLPLLGRELEVLTLGSKIQREVATAMSKSQRDFFLREQIRVIQRELGEGERRSRRAARTNRPGRLDR